MRPRDKPHGQGTKGTKRQGICDDTQGRRSTKSIVGQAIESRSYSGIEIKICSTMFLHSKEGWITMIGTRLQETQPGYNKGQNTTAINWRSN